MSFFYRGKTGNRNPQSHFCSNGSPSYQWYIFSVLHPLIESSLSSTTKHLADLLEAPILYPTEEEFKNPMEYILKVTPSVEKYGLCKIVPPEKYQLEKPLNQLMKEKKDWTFTTKIQNVHLLQNRSKILSKRDFTTMMSKQPDFESSTRKKRKNEPIALKDFGFKRTDQISITVFQKMADTFETSFFNSTPQQDPTHLPIPLKRKLARRGGICKLRNLNYQTTTNCKFNSVSHSQRIEHSYWNIVENVNKTIEPVTVYYGSDLDVVEYGTCFQKSTNLNWKCNVLPNLPQSLLKHIKSVVPGINSPMIYVGMLFSSFCWHTEDNFLFSVNYLHTGANKIWYGVPSSAALEFEKVMRKQLPELFENDPNLLQNLTTMISPSLLLQHNIPIYRMEHEPGTYMITFPRSFHAGFNCGFNVAESVNFAPVSHVLFGRLAFEQYKQIGRLAPYSHEQVILDAVQDLKTIPLSQQEIIKNEAKDILKREIEKRQQSGITQVQIMQQRSTQRRLSNFVRENKICIVCKQDCYLSHVSCAQCSSAHSEDWVTCLDHCKHLCSHHDKYILHCKYNDIELNKLLSSLK